MAIRSYAAQLLSILAIVSLFALPVFAQTDTELQATIRAAIQTDPRTAGMSEAQIDAMVGALSERAQQQGVTSEDIVWRPQPLEPEVETSFCGSMPDIFCSLNEAFGFDGSALLIPILLGLCSMALIVFLGYELEKHYLHPLGRRTPPPASY